jgi:hypothetical protein
MTLASALSSCGRESSRPASRGTPGIEALSESEYVVSDDLHIGEVHLPSVSAEGFVCARRSVHLEVDARVLSGSGPRKRPRPTGQPPVACPSSRRSRD